MKLLRFSTGGAAQYGLLEGAEVVALQAETMAEAMACRSEAIDHSTMAVRVAGSRARPMALWLCWACWLCRLLCHWGWRIQRPGCWRWSGRIGF